MSSFACSNPECSYVFSAAESDGQTMLRCPRCARETPIGVEKPPAMDLELDPPPVPVSSMAITRGVETSLPTARRAEEAFPADVDIGRGYYLLVRGRRVGPVPKRQLLEAGLDHFTLVWRPGAKAWRPAQQVADLEDVLRYVPPPEPGLGMVSARHLPRPRTLHALYWWLFFLALAVIVCLLFMVMFIVLFENVRTVDFRGFGQRNHTFEALAIFAGLMAATFGAASIVVYHALLYQMWKVVQDGYASLSPGTAVGLMFIPFLNIVWIFFAIAGLARELNLFLQRRGYDARPAAPGLALAQCICLIVPYVNLVTLIPLGLVSTAMLKNTAADIAQARRAEEQDL
jgi:hypothetical protein